MEVLVPLVALAIVFIATPVLSFDDRCPPAEKDQMGICLHGCDSNDNCTDGKICCSNGCGSVCLDVPVDPVTMIPLCLSAVRCRADPCTLKSCPSNPEANCVANYCGGCNAEFFDNNGTRVDDCNDVLPPKPECPPGLCRMFCSRGNVMDENGCPTCKCNECPTVGKCRFGKNRDEDGCRVCRDPPKRWRAALRRFNRRRQRKMGRRQFRGRFN